MIRTKQHHPYISTRYKPQHKTNSVVPIIFFILDSSNQRKNEIRDKVFHTRYLENGNNAYQLELPGLKDMLHTSRFLMDETSGQFYAVYGNTYQHMSTKPMLEQTWGTRELIDQLAVT